MLKNELTRRRAPPPLGAVESATIEELSRDIDIYTVSGFLLIVVLRFKAIVMRIDGTGKVVWFFPRPSTLFFTSWKCAFCNF